MSDGNGRELAAQVEELKQDVRELESHLPRVGALEHTTILQGAALSRIEQQGRATETNINTLRLELSLRDEEREKRETKRWEILDSILTSIAARVGVP
jgi:hypothetical protein